MYTYKDVAIVILNWNGLNLLQQFLPQVIAHSEGVNIYIVDNASTDDSISYIKTHYKDVQVIKHEKNYGFAKGYNLALQQVNEPILCLLNSDIQVTTNWLKPIIKAFNNSPKVDIIQPRILDFNNKTYFEYAGAAGGYIDALGYPYCRGRIFDTIEEDKNTYANNSTILWASGACFFIKNKVFNTLGGFDECYFAHMEEIDLCWRAFNQNYTAIYVGQSTVYHIGGATLQQGHPQKTYLNFRNSLLTLVKNVPKHIIFIVLVRMVLDGIAALKFLIQGQPKHTLAIFKAHISFYKNLNHAVAQRRNIQPAKTKRSYYTIKSIVWRYYVCKQKRYSEL